MKEINEDQILRDLILSCSSYIIPEPKPVNLEVFDYQFEDGMKIRTCKSCRCSECQSPDDEIWLCYFTSEYSLRVIDIYEKTGNFPKRCEACHEQ